MIFTRLNISDLILIEPDYHGDDRGYFSETFRKDLFEDFVGEEVNFIQDNESKSSKGVLRGLHFQTPPYSQSKLVRVIKGSVLDVAVDIRKSSKTFGEYISVELSDHNKRQLFIPRGFAHGFVVLSESAIFSYKVDSLYSPEHDRGILFNDEDLNINWEFDAKDIILSEKDLSHPSFSSSIDLFD